ncbi:hypothetical protein C8R43DRAFT_962317 [Mycena crocata]|nr:hypothetical protein C8R43DRAFT_962317 [Mycena crocata]
MSRARPEARKPAKPGPGSPSRAGPDSGLERAWGLGLSFQGPSRALKPGLVYGTCNVFGKFNTESKWELYNCAIKKFWASPGPGPSLGLASPGWGFGLGLETLKPKPHQAGPKPGLPGRAGPWTSLLPTDNYLHSPRRGR